MPTILFQDSFASGTLAAWSGQSVVGAGAVAAALAGADYDSDGYGAHLSDGTANAYGDAGQIFENVSWPASNVLSVQFRVKINSVNLTGADEVILGFHLGAPIYNFVDVGIANNKANGVWAARYYSKAGSVVSTDFSSALLTTGAWHLLEFTIDNSGASPVYTVHVDGTLVVSVTDATSGTFLQPDSVYFGPWTYDLTTVDMYVDAVVIANGYIGTGGTAHNQTVAATAASSTAITKTVGAIRAATASSAAILSRQVAIGRSATAANVATVLKTAAHGVAAVGGSTTTLVKSPMHALAAVGASLATVGKAVSAARGAVAGSTVSAAKEIAHAVGATAASAATIGAVKVIVFAVSATAGSIARWGPASVGKALAGTSAATSALGRGVSATRGATAAANAGIAKGLTHTIAATAVTSATISKGIGHAIEAVESALASLATSIRRFVANQPGGATLTISAPWVATQSLSAPWAATQSISTPGEATMTLTVLA